MLYFILYFAALNLMEPKPVLLKTLMRDTEFVKMVFFDIAGVFT